MYSATLGRVARGVAAVGAVAVVAAGCTWGNETPIGLPAGGGAADSYPSVVNVPAGTGTFDINGEGNVLDGIMVLLCGVSSPTDGSTVDTVLQSPAGGTVALTHGFTSPKQTDVLALDEGLYELILGEISGPSGLVAHPARHAHAFRVGPKNKAKVVRRVARLFRRHYAHRPSSTVTGRSAIGGTPVLSCDSSDDLVVESGIDSPDSLPTPAPPAPYGSDLTALLGSNPRGDWNLWSATNAGLRDVLARPGLQARPADLPEGSGSIVGGWDMFLASHVVEGKPFQDGGDFTVTGADTAASPVTLTMKVHHDTSRLVTPTGQVDFIECTTPLCDGNTVGTASLVPDTTLGSSTATLTLPAGSLSPGTHRYEAVYYGDPNFDMLTSVQQSLDIAGTTTS